MDVFPTSRFRVQATKISTLESSETLNWSRNLNLVMNIPSLIKSKDSIRMCSWIYIYGDGQNELADGRKSSHYSIDHDLLQCKGGFAIGSLIITSPD